MTQPDSSPPVQQAGKTSLLLSVLGGLFIACFFLFFTWRGLLLYYTGDDMMNLYIYWSKPVSALVKGNLLFLDALLSSFRRHHLSNVLRDFRV